MKQLMILIICMLYACKKSETVQPTNVTVTADTVYMQVACKIFPSDSVRFGYSGDIPFEYQLYHTGPLTDISYYIRDMFMDEYFADSSTYRTDGRLRQNITCLKSDSVQLIWEGSPNFPVPMSIDCIVNIGTQSFHVQTYDSLYTSVVILPGMTSYRITHI